MRILLMAGMLLFQGYDPQSTPEGERPTHCDNFKSTAPDMRVKIYFTDNAL